jgi:hypothetical protein
VAGRRDDDILVWDVRGTGEVLCSMKRAGDTNQRLHFDVRDRVVATGDQVSNEVCQSHVKISTELWLWSSVAREHSVL